jgi:hypothetical protein
MQSNFDDWFDVMCIRTHELVLVPNPNYHELLPEEDKTIEVPRVAGREYRVAINHGDGDVVIAHGSDTEKVLEEMREFVASAAGTYLKLKQRINADALSAQGDTNG